MKAPKDKGDVDVKVPKVKDDIDVDGKGFVDIVSSTESRR